MLGMVLDMYAQATYSVMRGDVRRARTRVLLYASTETSKCNSTMIIYAYIALPMLWMVYSKAPVNPKKHMATLVPDVLVLIKMSR